MAVELEARKVFTDLQWPDYKRPRTIACFRSHRRFCTDLGLETAVNRPNPVPANANTIALGQKLYVSNCMICHGQAGKGDGPGGAALEKRPTDLTARVRAGATDGELFWKITEGRSPMLSWKGSLTETQRWELVDYIKTLGGK